MDGISDTWMKEVRNYWILEDLWKKDSLNEILNSFEMRLLPLNKKHP